MAGDVAAAARTGPAAPAMPRPASSAADPAIAAIRLPDMKVIINSSRWNTMSRPQ